MPRLTPDQKIERAEKTLANAKQTLKDLRKQKKAEEAAQKVAMVEELAKKLVEDGFVGNMSTEEILAKLKS